MIVMFYFTVHPFYKDALKKQNSSDDLKKSLSGPCGMVIKT